MRQISAEVGHGFAARHKFGLFGRLHVILPSIPSASGYGRRDGLYSVLDDPFGGVQVVGGLRKYIRRSHGEAVHGAISGAESTWGDRFVFLQCAVV